MDLRCTQILRSTTNIVGASLLAMDVNDNACIQNARSGLRFFASRLAPTVDLRCMQILRSATEIVGASLLAMDVNDNACIQNARSGLRFFASRLAPTGGERRKQSGRLAGRLVRRYHSTGRALARLPLLILIHRPRREAERRYSSGGSA